MGIGWNENTTNGGTTTPPYVSLEIMDIHYQKS